MAQNTGKAYERLTQRVFQALLSQQSVTTIRVEHDVTLQGITGSHQVDVYWEFETGGITYQTVVECKDWQDPVSQGTLLTLHSVLLDLPGQPRGVVVARNGFQEGAAKFAAAHGIALYELRAPRDRLLELSPAHWKQTLEQPETQQKLLANVFRRIALSPPS